jgi:hypothetical protein
MKESVVKTSFFAGVTFGLTTRKLLIRTRLVEGDTAPFQGLNNEPYQQLATAMEAA